MSSYEQEVEQRGIDQRREVRRPANGRVRMWVDEPLPIEIEGQLVDVSAGGFRAAHGCSSLGSGQLVRFRHNTSTGTARVIWTRIVGPCVETGFLVL
ncbi:MAG TPA: hypothetical protein VKV15_19145 [Bryobacteraceae bacterium]|nr:hypothetical protein [Bryobacteraceae bacterium]